jgi:ubiquinol-cytochrome c reductase cytochrome c subunit
MSSRVWLLAVTVVAALWLAPGVKIHAQSSVPQQALSALTPAGNAENGKKLFAADGCYQCHGYEAQGAGGTGPRLAPNPMPFPQLSRYVRAPTGQMPPYTAKVLSGSELADIYAFLQSRPQPPALDSVPLLK